VVRDVGQANWGRDAMPFWRRTATLWNEAAAGVEGWPQITLKLPPTPHVPRIYSS
jgi:hypothetical protein